MNVNFNGLNLKLGHEVVERIGNGCKDTSFKFVGHYLDEYLSWDIHIKHVTSKLASANYAIARTRNFLPIKIRKSLYNSLFRSHAEFGILSWGCSPQTKLNKICTLQKKCVRNVANVGSRAHSEPLFSKLKILTFTDLFKMNACNFIHQYHYKKLPASFTGMFQLLRDSDNIMTREGHENYVVSVPISRNLLNLPRPSIIPIWNGISDTLKATISHKVFKKQCKNTFLESYETEVHCELPTCEYCSL